MDNKMKNLIVYFCEFILILLVGFVMVGLMGIFFNLFLFIFNHPSSFKNSIIVFGVSSLLFLSCYLFYIFRLVEYRE